MTPATERGDVASIRDKSLLLVEDDEILLARLAVALQALGFTVRSANSIENGLEMVRAFPPAFAVVDLRLTDGSGLSIVSAMRSARPDSHSIIMTGYGNIPTAVSAAKLGANDYLTETCRRRRDHRRLADPSRLRDATAWPSYGVGREGVGTYFKRASSMLEQCVPGG